MASGSTALRSAVDPTGRRPNPIAVPPDDHESIVDHHARRTRAGLRPRRSRPPVTFAASGPLAEGGRREDGRGGRIGELRMAQADAAQGIDETVGHCREPHAELVGRHRGGRRTIGKKLELLADAVLGLAAGTAEQTYTDLSEG
jgi:hypothetical protein